MKHRNFPKSWNILYKKMSNIPYHIMFGFFYAQHIQMLTGGFKESTFTDKLKVVIHTHTRRGKNTHKCKIVHTRAYVKTPSWLKPIRIQLECDLCFPCEYKPSGRRKPSCFHVLVLFVLSWVLCYSGLVLCLVRAEGTYTYKQFPNDHALSRKSAQLWIIAGSDKVCVCFVVQAANNVCSPLRFVCVCWNFNS